MRSLNTSLPSSNSHQQPPEQLLQAFKAAALSVTTLYKSAVTDQAQARQSGYQEAIEDLLQFLDRKHLGLGDGEGWQVRQWATERLDGPLNSDSEDDDKPARSLSPLAQRKAHQDTEQQQQAAPVSIATPPSRTNQTVVDEQGHQDDREQREGAVSNNVDESIDTSLAKTPVFTFTAAPTFPVFSAQDVDMQSSDTISTTPISLDEAGGAGKSMLSRAAWNSSSRVHTSSRRSPAHNTSLGNKRKLQLPDFFDLSGLNGRDFSGGGKRGRFT